MRHSIASASIAVIFVGAVVASVGCEVLQPPPKPKEPQPGFYLSTPFPDVRAFNDIIVLKPGLAYIVGTDGTILKGVQGVADAKKGEEKLGMTWTKEDSGVTDDLQAIAGFLVDADTETEREVLMVVGHNGVVLQRSAPGEWAPVPSGKTGVLFSVMLRSELDGFIVGEAGTILRWNGTALADQATQTLQQVQGLACPANRDCGAGNQCLTDPVDSIDKCNSFFTIPEALKGVGGGGEILAVGSRGAVYSFNADGDPVGGRWTKEESGTTRNLASVFTRNGTWMPTTDGVLLLRNGPGDYNDDDFRTPAPVFLQDVWVDQGNIFAVGFSQEIFRNDGSGWTLATVAEDAEMRGIDGYEAPPDNDPEGGAIATFIAVGAGGRIVRGPFVLPVAGETALGLRIGDSDFISP